MEESLGQIIRRARKNKGFSMATLAKMVSLSQGSISLIENNKRGLSVESLKKISEVLEIEENILLEASLKQKDEKPFNKEEVFSIGDGSLFHKLFIEEIFAVFENTFETKTENFSPEERNLILHLLKLDMDRCVPGLIGNAIEKFKNLQLDQ